MNRSIQSRFSALAIGLASIPTIFPGRCLAPIGADAYNPNRCNQTIPQTITSRRREDPSASNSQGDDMSVAVGDLAPDFELKSHAGGTVKLSDFRGTKNVFIAFYPLDWTPV
jgi:hypothetical protein